MRRLAWSLRKTNGKVHVIHELFHLFFSWKRKLPKELNWIVISLSFDVMLCHVYGINVKKRKVGSTDIEETWNKQGSQELYRNIEHLCHDWKQMSLKHDLLLFTIWPTWYSMVERRPNAYISRNGVIITQTLLYYIWVALMSQSGSYSWHKNANLPKGNALVLYSRTLS